MSEETGMLQPTIEHQRLKELCGTWTVDCTYFMGPDEPVTQPGTETVEMFGRFFTVSTFETEMMGMPLRGKATVGYEPTTERWVSTWYDTFTPNLYYFTGRYDESGEVLAMSGQAVDPHSGQLTNYRTIEKSVDPNTREFDMFMEMPDTGQEIQLLHYVYRRA